MAAGMETIVSYGEWGALLKYPYQVKLVERTYRGYASGHTTEDSAKKKGRKKRRELNEGEMLQVEHHMQIREKLLQSYVAMMKAAKLLNYFPLQQIDHIKFRSDVDFAAMCKLSLLAHQTDRAPILLDRDTSGEDVFGSVIANTIQQQVKLSVLGREFVVPPESSFLLSNLSQISPLYEYAGAVGKYDLIVIDPPWENRSAIRGKKYEWLLPENLLNLSIHRLAAEGAIIAIWVTNKRTLVAFILQHLFSNWGVCHLAEWHWLKVTTNGELIHEIDSTHKKPYETVIIGYVMKQSEIPAAKRICLKANEKLHEESEDYRGGNFPSDDHHENVISHDQHLKSDDDHENVLSDDKREINSCDIERQSTEPFPSLPKSFIFTSIVSQAHSQKPYLGDLINKCGITAKRKLELFARNLLPGWTSWGNEFGPRLKQKTESIQETHERILTRLNSLESS